MNVRPTIHNIQILRAIAAMMVVFHHAIGQMERRGGRDLGFEIEIGQAGVDLFFVISGFIMVYVTQARQRTPLKFWRDRLVRIVPLYWFYTLAMAIIAILLPHLLKIADFQFVHFLKSMLFIPAQHPKFDTMIWPLLVQGWSLNYEMFFYIIFGLVLLVKNPNRRITILSIVLIGLVLIGIIASLTESNVSGALWQTYTSPLLIEFLIGALIGATYSHWRRPMPRISWACICIGLGLFALATWQPNWAPLRLIT